MTVSTVVDHNDYTGNGVTTSFPYTFRIFNKTDLTVSVIDLSENITVLVLDTDYTVKNAGGYNGGSVVLTTPLASGWKISVARELSATQETDLRNQGKFFAEVHEDAFDKLTMLIQQVGSMFRLALRKPSSIANWYDALGNYIRNVRDPRDPQDAATKNYVDVSRNSLSNKTLRVPESFINELPPAESRANKAIGFDNNGSVIVSDPAGTGLWGYVLIDSFQSGANITQRFEALRWLQPDGNGEYYRWDGALPKFVPANSTPASAGGIGIGAWVSIGDASLRPLVEVTANVVGTNNYQQFPQIGGSLTAGNDYLLNDVLYTTVGESGTVISVAGNVVTTTGGTAYLLDKRWPINDVRAWGVKDGVLADVELTNAVTYITRKGGGIRFINVPGIALVLDEVTFTDLNSVNIHFNGTYILGSATTNKNAVITVKNAHTASFTGTVFMENISKKYTYGLYMTAALPSLIAPETGILHNFTIQDLRVSGFPSAVCIGDGSDAQMSEINIGMTSHACNNGVTVNGSQAIVSTTGQIMSGPQPEFTYDPTAFLALGGIIYHNGGEVLCSVDNDSRIATVAPVASALYGNPCGSVKITGAHIECAGLLMYARQGSGIVGDVDSKYSCVSFSNCQGSMLNGNGELISVALNGYEGTFSADATCNFYTSATRNKRIVYSVSPNFHFDVSPRAFMKGFGVLAEEIGSGNVIWHHDMQPIMNLTPNSITVPNGLSSPIGFSARASTGDYLFYYGDTSPGGIVIIHELTSMVISIAVLSSTLLTISVLVNGNEIFACQGGGSVTLPRNYLTAGSVIEFVARNSSGSPSTISNASRIIVSGANNK